jgi:hypothetical protein
MKMKSSQPRARLRKGLAVGSALLVSAGISGESVGGQIPDVSMDSLEGLPQLDNPFQFGGDVNVATPTVPVRVALETRGWSKSDAKKFRDLVIKRAAGTVTAEENKEFAILQHRRRANEQVSADEVIAEWQRRRFVSEILEVLDRNVRFFKTEDKARLRSIRNAART